MAAERSTILVFRQSPPSAGRSGGVLTCLTKSPYEKTGIPPTIYHLQYSCFPFSVLLVIYTAAVTPLNAAFCSTVAEILVIFSRILVLQRTLIALFKYPPVFIVNKRGWIL